MLRLGERNCGPNHTRNTGYIVPRRLTNSNWWRYVLYRVPFYFIIYCVWVHFVAAVELLAKANVSLTFKEVVSVSKRKSLVLALAFGQRRSRSNFVLSLKSR